MRRFQMVWLIALLLAATPALAEIGKGNWEVGFSFGAARLDSEVTDDAATWFDVRGGYFFADHFQVEGQVSVASAEDGEVVQDLSGLYLNLVGNFRPRKKVVPYILAGVGSVTLGTATDLGPYRMIIEDDATGYQVAAGARFFVRREGKLAVRLELVGQTEDAFDRRKTHGALSVGVTWRLGKAPSAR